MAYSDCLPMELQEELIQLSDAQSHIEFRIGDIVAAAVAYNRQNQRPASITEIQSAVGAFCGKSARTVRDYSDVAAFYPPPVRDEYAVLKFAHFRQAMVLGSSWEKALAWAVAQGDELGRPASVDAMIAQFTPEGEVPEEDDYTGDGDGEAAPEQSPVMRVQQALVTIREMLPVLGIGGSAREQAETAIEVLFEVVLKAGLKQQDVV